jgi:hypothetical protein
MFHWKTDYGFDLPIISGLDPFPQVLIIYIAEDRFVNGLPDVVPSAFSSTKTSD